MEDINAANATDAALILLTASIFFALVIERVLEVAKTVFDYIEARNNLNEFWTRSALNIRERLQNRLEKTKDNKLQKNVFEFLAWRYVNTDHPDYEGAQVISAARVRAFTVKGVSKGIGVMLGISVAFGLDINVFELIAQWTRTKNEIAINVPLPMGVFEVNLPLWLQSTITGVIMGLGSGPMHKFITALERAKRNRKSTDEA